MLLSDGRILSWSDDAHLCIWSNDGEQLRVLEGHTDPVEGARLMFDGRILSWSRNGILRLWSADGEPLRMLEGHTDDIKDVLLLPDGRVLSWSGDKTLRLWDLDNGRCLKILEGHADDVEGVHLLPDGRALTWSWDKTLRLWDIESGTCLGIYKIENLFSAPEEVWRTYLAEKATTTTAGLHCAGNAAILGYQTENAMHCLYWQGASTCEARNLFDDGRAIVTQTNGQVCFLQTYYGNYKISLSEIRG